MFRTVLLLMFAGRKCRNSTGGKLSSVHIQQRICWPWNATSKGLNIL